MAGSAPQWRPANPGQDSNRDHTNRSGRPAAGMSFAELFIEELNRLSGEFEAVDPAKETKKQRAVRELVNRILRPGSDLAALQTIMERVEGKVPDKVQADVTSSIRVVPWNAPNAGLTYSNVPLLPGHSDRPQITADQPGRGETSPRNPRRGADLTPEDEFWGQKVSHNMHYPTAGYAPLPSTQAPAGDASTEPEGGGGGNGRSRVLPDDQD